MVLLLHILLNLLGSQDNLISNKANLGPSRVILLGKRDKFIFNKVTAAFNKVTPQDNLDNLTSSKVSEESTKGIPLGRVVILPRNKVNPLLRLSSHLDKLVNLTFNKVNQSSSRPNPLFRKENPWQYKENLVPSKLGLLGNRAHLRFNQGKLPDRLCDLHLFKDIFPGLLNRALK